MDDVPYFHAKPSVACNLTLVKAGAPSIQTIEVVVEQGEEAGRRDSFQSPSDTEHGQQFTLPENVQALLGKDSHPARFPAALPKFFIQFSPSQATA
jgi:hypothetical protein